MTQEKWPAHDGVVDAAQKTNHPDHSILSFIPRREAQHLLAELAMGGIAGAYAESYLTRLRSRRATLGELARAIRQLRRRGRE